MAASRISLGEKIHLDLDVLLRSRLLIQANSGGGKSWCIRRIAEQSFGKLPIVIIDPEGEFASLREKFGFVLVGKGGETPTDVRSAALVAHRLLELRASAVCDIFELPPSQRHGWVKTFLQAMIDAPKELWHPTLIIVDEAHTFCPEKGAGESEAAEAMISLATRGRKRGFTAIFATQRLSKLRKDAAAELHNNLIGKSFIDTDRKRAAEQLGIQSKDFHNFSEKMKLLPQGVFLGQGVAISTELVEFKVGGVVTTHPDINEKPSAALAPPPAPEDIKHLLPKLADLPKAAEEKAKTEADLRGEIRSLRAQLRVAPTATREIQVADPKAIERAVRQATAQSAAQLNEMQRVIARLKKALADVSAVAVKAAGVETPTITAAASLIQARPIVREKQQSAPTNGTGQMTDLELSGPHRKILRALSELLSIGKEMPPRDMVAAWASYSPIGGAFGNPLGELRSMGLVDYPQPAFVCLTEAGKSAIGTCVPPDREELQARIDRICTGPERKILTALIEHGAEEVARDELAAKSDYSPIGGAFGNPVGALRTKGLLDYPRKGFVKAADWLVESLT